MCIGTSCVLFIARKVQQIRTQIRCTDKLKLAMHAIDKAKMKA